MSFEEFINRNSYPPSTIPNYNNFYLYFIGGKFWDQINEKRVHYQKFAFEHPEIVLSLRNKIQNQIDKSKNRSEALKPFDKDLYEAYKIMRGYGASDKELFA
ncbi:MAG: hypothetical protein AAB786_02280 [Patescibacteria group bacterium]